MHHEGRNKGTAPGGNNVRAGGTPTLQYSNMVRGRTVSSVGSGTCPAVPHEGGLPGDVKHVHRLAQFPLGAQHLWHREREREDAGTGGTPLQTKQLRSEHTVEPRTSVVRLGRPSATRKGQRRRRGMLRSFAIHLGFGVSLKAGMTRRGLGIASAKLQGHEGRSRKGSSPAHPETDDLGICIPTAHTLLL